MVYNKFFFQILIRVILIISLSLVGSFIFLRQDLLFTQLLIVLMLIGLIAELTSFVSRTNQDLARFLASVKDRDFTVNFTESKSSQSFSNLGKSFNELALTLRELETNNAGQSQFLSLLIDQMEFGVITFNAKDEITLINRYATEWLQIPAVSNWKKIQNPNTAILSDFLVLGETKNKLLETKVGHKQLAFSVSATKVIIREETFRIITFQDIQSEIQQKEIEAWQKLIRILTHEIMNSVTPVVSLAETVRMILRDDEGSLKQLEELEEDNLEDINEALNTIHDRGQGIIDFVSNYRKVTRVPIPQKELEEVSSMIENVITLMRSTSEDPAIEMTAELFSCKLELDKSLTTQVLINLVKNGMEALADSSIQDKRLSITMTHANDQLIISIADNASGIPENKLDQIFVPFFTTKKEGSGIGLSLSRQIMSAQGGSLELKSTSEKGTVFEMVLPV